MANILVKDSAGLVAALKTVKNGDTILLAGGTYSDVYIKGANFSSGVTIQSADAGKPAILTSMTLRDSKGLTFSGLEFSVDPAKGIYSYRIEGSANINLTKLNVHGTMDGDPSDDTSPILIRNSTGVTVTHSEFQQLWHGVSFIDSDQVTITDNYFHDIRTDGVRGGGTSNLKIANNYFTDFYPAAADHPDAIQLWSTNAKNSAENIVISDNVVVRGEGSAIQGIFIRDTFNNLPFKNVLITGNTVVGAMYNGISVGGASEVTVQNNRVVGMDGQDSWIRLSGVTSGTLSDNQATGYNYTNADVVRSGNIVLASVSGATSRTLAAIGPEGGIAKSAAALAKLVDKTVSKLSYAETDTVDTGEHAFVRTVKQGTAGNDRLGVGAIGDFRLEGGDGADTLTGGGTGKHQLAGGAGADTYAVLSLTDIVEEQADGGYDTVNASVDYTLASNVEVLRLMKEGLTGIGNELDNRVVGTAGKDIIFGMGGDDAVQAGAGNDVIYGGAGNDTLRGEDGDDLIFGEGGTDTLLGGAGSDVIYFGTGGGTAEGGTGADRVFGGSGADSFLFRAGDFGTTALDEIHDFSRADKDKIALNMIDAKSATAADDKFAFIGTAGFGKVAGQLRYEVKNNDSYVMGDTNGDGKADFTIKIAGVTSLAGSDFVL